MNITRPRQPNPTYFNINTAEPGHLYRQPNGDTIYLVAKDMGTKARYLINVANGLFIEFGFAASVVLVEVQGDLVLR